MILSNPFYDSCLLTLALVLSSIVMGDGHSKFLPSQLSVVNVDYRIATNSSALIDFLVLV